MERLMSSKSGICPERLRLSEAVTIATNEVYKAKSSKEKAKARKAEREAIRALNEHRNEHDC